MVVIAVVFYFYANLNGRGRAVGSERYPKQNPLARLDRRESFLLPPNAK
jgi:hypothetical protein